MEIKIYYKSVKPINQITRDKGFTSIEEAMDFLKTRCAILESIKPSDYIIVTEKTKIVETHYAVEEVTQFVATKKKVY